MPAAVTKQELITLTRAEFEKLHTCLQGITDAQALRRDEDETSIKDIIAHRAHWVHLFLGWYADGQAGKEVFFPAKGYKWNQLKAYNQALREAQKDLSWPDAIVQLERAHDDLCTFIEATEEPALYGGPMKGANNAWTAGRWAEASGPSHYRSAAKYIRKRLKAL